MRGEPPACVICPVFEPGLGTSLKVVYKEITAEEVERAKAQADAATEIAGVGLSRSKGMHRRPMGCVEAAARSKQRIG